MDPLYANNTIQSFWKITDPIEDCVWEDAVEWVFSKSGMAFRNYDDVLAWSLGECSYGNEQWRLPFSKRAYYFLKPLIPQMVSKQLRRILSHRNTADQNSTSHWPIDDRLMEYAELVLSRVMDLTDKAELEMINFWPDHKRNAFVLTHDIETDWGQKQVERVASVDEKYGFRSAFFFIAHRYQPDIGLINSLVERGFEVGVHGYNHDGKLFCMGRCPMERIKAINRFADEIGARSFRSPLTLRDPNRMQSLSMQFDLSFFDTDPFEPMPGGTMSVFPFQMGKLCELPYTLAQDYTLFELLQETTPRIWQQKVDYLQKVHGMMLLDTHPDYLLLGNNLDKYEEFLDGMRAQLTTLYHSLPCEVGAWWLDRMAMDSANLQHDATVTRILRNKESSTLSFVL